MRTKRILVLLAWLMGSVLPALSQAPRLSYHDERFVMRHELNPSFQPDSDFMAVNASFSVSSSMRMQDLFYQRPNGTLTTFMGNAAVNKDELMRKVGGGMNGLGDIRFGIFSMGRRKSPERYQTLSASLRANGVMHIGRGLFDCMKDVSNGQYDLSGTRFALQSWLELAVGESRQLDSRWTVGARAKLLLGLNQLRLGIQQMHVSLAEDVWQAAGQLSADVAGMRYRTAPDTYQEREGTYEKVKGVSLSAPIPRGLGLALDLGATYRLDSHWQLSASLLDLGFLTWFSSHHAQNGGQPFTFDGFHEATLAADSETSVEKQLHRIEDGFADLTRLTPDGHHLTADLLRATVHLGASCDYGKWFGGFLLTTRVQGSATWVEPRLNVGWRPLNSLSFTLSPSWSSYGRFSVGAMATYTHPRGYQAYLGSDALFWKLNKQLIPLSLNGALHVGLVLPF